MDFKITMSEQFFYTCKDIEVIDEILKTVKENIRDTHDLVPVGEEYNPMNRNPIETTFNFRLKKKQLKIRTP